MTVHVFAIKEILYKPQNKIIIIIIIIIIIVINVKTESIRKSSNINFSWTKIEYQNNLNPIALFSTLSKS